MALFCETYGFIFRTANLVLFSLINISYVSLNKYLNKNVLKRTKNSLENQSKNSNCILQQVQYSTVEYNFIIECGVCIGKVSIFMNHGL